MTKHQKTLINELIQVHISDLLEKINECKKYKCESVNSDDKKFLDESIKLWQTQLSEFKNIKL